MCRDHRDGYKGLVSAAQARTSSERDAGLIPSLRPLRREPYPEFIKGWRIAPGVTWEVDGAGLKTVVVRGKLSMPVPWGGDGYG